MREQRLKGMGDVRRFLRRTERSYVNAGVVSKECDVNRQVAGRILTLLIDEGMVELWRDSQSRQYRVLV